VCYTQKIRFVTISAAARSNESIGKISFSSQVSGFPARGSTNTCVCGFH
jgi:hypothetical protein